MPHNLYLHSSIVQTRDWQPTTEKRWEAIKLDTIDSTFALSIEFFVTPSKFYFRTGYLTQHQQIIF
ncbi:MULTISPECIES: divalent metal cation transporter [Anabaena]|uniref:divalent metal cation transporter n=1 Tax=Anabaena TaxID=1163 RepID=UPI0003086EDB|nr:MULTISPECIES: divalent metal cation transporter [Anabaena]MCM2405529.1 divalent metal cation transporter [Anabaena sp. CCAP 1446/1C]BAY06549.1 manganese transport protein [Anabaena cylindrica PCC 7122]